MKGGGRENRENVKERRKRKDERKTELKIVFKKCKRPKRFMEIKYWWVERRGKYHFQTGGYGLQTTYT